MDEKTQSANKKNDEEEQQQDWGGWGLSPLSFLSDLQKAATVAAEEISRNVRFETNAFYFNL